MASSPPSGFRFFGFGVFGNCQGNAYMGNNIESKSSTPLGAAFLVYGPHVLDGNLIENNRFVSLAQVLDGTPAGATLARNNGTCKMHDVNLESVSLNADACKPNASVLSRREK